MVKKIESLEKIKDEKFDELRKKLQLMKNKIDRFQKKLLDKFDKYILGIALLPPKNIEKERKIAKEEGRELNKEEVEKLKKGINILILFDDSDSKKMSKLELKERLIGITSKIGEEIDKNIMARIMILSEMRQDCFDGKWEFLSELAITAPVYDPKDLLAALKVAEVHKQMVLKKFEKYITSYVAAGSLFRGEKSNDIDVYVIVDDTDVKRMPRFELKDKLRHIIISQAFEANAITKVDKKFHVQVYILTDFWEGIKDANPVFFTLLRDGIPLYDRGVFMPWKLLLEMGRIKPSKEAIDIFMSSGEKILDRVKFKLKEIVEADIYWAILSPSQAALMLYGVAPPTPKETVKLLDEIFVQKEKLLEKKYVDILEKIRKCYKDIEHEKLKELKGEDIDDLLKDANEYLKRIKKLFEQIEKKKEKENVIEICGSCETIVKDGLKLANIKIKNLEIGLKRLVDKKEIPGSYFKIFKNILKVKQDYGKGKLTKHEIEKIKKDARNFIRGMIEYVQRKRGAELERVAVKVKYGNKFGEVLLLDKVAFIIKDIDKKEEVLRGEIRKDGSIVEIQKSDLKELEEVLSKMKMLKRVFIKEKSFENLKEIFGKNVEVLVSY